MNCPKCGLQTAPGQKFCRSCGASLQIITQRLPQLESPAPDYTRKERGRTNSLTSWGFIIMFIGVAIGVVGKKLVHEDIVTVIGVLVALAGMFLSVYPYLSIPSRSKHRGSTSSESELPGEAKPPKSLPQERTIEYVPGVTERTTDLLTSSAVPRRRAEGKDSPE